MLEINNIKLQQDLLFFENSDSNIQRWSFSENDNILYINFNLDNKQDVEQSRLLLNAKKIECVINGENKTFSCIKSNLQYFNNINLITIKVF